MKCATANDGETAKTKAAPQVGGLGGNVGPSLDGIGTGPPLDFIIGAVPNHKTNAHVQRKNGSPAGGGLCILKHVAGEVAIVERTDPFITTHWSVVLAAGVDSSPRAQNALEQLCRTYWYPLYACVRRKGHNEEDAQDLTQEFFRRLLDRQDLATLHPTRGRFRAFLLVALNHFLANQWRHASTLKRGGGSVAVPLDLYGAEAHYILEAKGVGPERLFDRRWAQGVLDRAATALRQEFSAADRGRVFDELNRFLSLPAAKGEYDDAAAKLELAPGTVAWTVHRMRQRFAELARQEIAQTVSTPLEVEEETRYLLEVMGANPAM